MGNTSWQLFAFENLDKMPDNEMQKAKLSGVTHGALLKSVNFGTYVKFCPEKKANHNLYAGLQFDTSKLTNSSILQIALCISD